MTDKENQQDQVVGGQGEPEKQPAGKSAKTASPKKRPENTPKKPDRSAKLKELQKDLQEQKDKYLRLSADFDNFRKRTMREKIEMQKQAGEEILVKILPVLDDLERAMKFIDDARDMESVKEGILLISNKFKEYLSQQGVREIEAMHMDFDTDVHEAITQIPSSEKKLKGKVVDIIEKGYYLHDRVIRYSKVVIGA